MLTSSTTHHSNIFQQIQTHSSPVSDLNNPSTLNHNMSRPWSAKRIWICPGHKYEHLTQGRIFQSWPNPNDALKIFISNYVDTLGDVMRIAYKDCCVCISSQTATTAPPTTRTTATATTTTSCTVASNVLLVHFGLGDFPSTLQEDKRLPACILEL